MITQPVGRVSVEDEGRQILAECRATAVGVQALLGFQLLSILTPALYDRLEPALRSSHLAGIVLVLISMFLLMTPGSYHRLAESGLFTAQFVESSSVLTGWALAFLRLGLILEIYTAARAMGMGSEAATALAGALLLLSWTLWSVYPRVSVMRLAPHPKSD